MTRNRKRKSLIEAATENEYGIDPSTIDMEGVDISGGRDVTYVPGYSDMRRERDEAIHDVVNGDRDPATVPKMPVYLRWVRAFSAKKQETDGTKPFSAEMNGFRSVKEEDIGNPWLTEMPPGARVLPDGSIAQGDTILFVATAEAAARNSKRNRMMVETQLDAIGAGIMKAADDADTEGEITKKRGKPVRVRSRRSGGDSSSE